MGDFKILSENKEDFIFEAGKEVTVKGKAGFFLICVCILITLITLSFTFFQAFLLTKNIAYSVGQTMGPLLLAAVVVLCFQIGKSFRNNKSRFKVYFWTMFVGLFASILQFITMISGIR